MRNGLPCLPEVKGKSCCGPEKPKRPELLPKDDPGCRASLQVCDAGAPGASMAAATAELINATYQAGVTKNNP